MLGSFLEGQIMTEDNKKAMYWSGGLLAALVVLVAILWTAGVFNTAAVQ